VEPFAVSGLTLSCLVDTRDTALQKNCTFTGTNPLSAEQVVQQLNTAVGDVVAFDESGSIRFTSTETGTGSKIEIVSSSAAVLLGFTAGQRDVGEQVYIALVPNQDTYTVQDQDGEGGHYYRSFFFHTVTLLQGPPGPAFLGRPGLRLTSDRLCRCTLDLVDMSGNAAACQNVSFYALHRPMMVDQYGVALDRTPKRISVDNEGHAEIMLVRGLQVRVVFEGTSLVRDVTIPDADECDILGLIANAPDPWNLVEIQLPAAPRRTI
jgi:hypothetical protein